MYSLFSTFLAKVTMDGLTDEREVYSILLLFSLPFYYISLIISYEKCMVYVMGAGRLFALIVFFSSLLHLLFHLFVGCWSLE